MANRRGLSPWLFTLVIIFYLSQVMLPIKSKEIADYTLAAHSPGVQAELAALAQLSFTFEMDGFRGPPDDHTHNTHRSSAPASTTQPTNSNTRQDANYLVHLAAAAGIAPHHMFPPHTYNSTMSPEAGHLNFHDTGFARGGMSHLQSPQAPSADFNVLQRALDQTYGAQAFTSGPGPSQRPRENSTYSLDIDNQTEADTVSIDEEKRRRNTAASARFRIKKKQRAINLKRSISDLTGRAEDLEREVADLRRENGWLKEIVMLKNTQFPPVNHMSDSCQRTIAVPSSSTSRSRQTNAGSDSDSTSSDEEQPKAKKGGSTKTAKD